MVSTLIKVLAVADHNKCHFFTIDRNGTTLTACHVSEGSGCRTKSYNITLKFLCGGTSKNGLIYNEKEK